jgi:trehalose synthase
MGPRTQPEARIAAVRLEHVDVAPLGLDRFESVLGAAAEAEFERTAVKARALLDGRVVWNVNSTANGGGVAEMLRSLVAYGRGAGVDARWVVIGGEPDFFRVTKRLHNRLHGAPGDGGPLGADERAIFEATAAGAAAGLQDLVKPGDVVLLHDPQTAAMVEPMVRTGAHVLWRAHIGLDLPNSRAREAWQFLLPYVRPAARYIFSRAAYAWEGLEPDRVAVIAPSIDPFSPKNQELSPSTVRAVLHAAGLLSDHGSGSTTFTRHDGSLGRIARRADIVDGVLVPEGVPVVAQVSRWDRLKDPLGVLEAFVDTVVPESDAHLVLAGPETGGVADDPEAVDVLLAAMARWHSLAPEVRGRVHLIELPMADAEENAVMVNAVQRWATIVCQKSLAEGFGLTVAEAMWKARPVVASRVGGIQDQIVDGVSGALVDPADLSAFGAVLVGLLNDPDRAAAMGAAAQARVRADFLGARHLEEYVDLFDGVIQEAARL